MKTAYDGFPLTFAHVCVFSFLVKFPAAEIVRVMTLFLYRIDPASLYWKAKVPTRLKIFLQYIL